MNWDSGYSASSLGTLKSTFFSLCPSVPTESRSLIAQHARWRRALSTPHGPQKQTRTELSPIYSIVMKPSRLEPRHLLFPSTHSTPGKKFFEAKYPSRE